MKSTPSASSTFQFTRPRGARHLRRHALGRWRIVSIHAPARGCLLYTSGQYAWTYSGNGTNVWEGRVNDVEASRIAALAEVNAGSIVGATINGPHTVATNDGILAFTVVAPLAGA